MNRLVGEKVDPESIDNLARRIRKDLHVASVTHRLVKGSEAEHVKVVFDVNGHRQDFDVNIPKAIFSSRQGWSGAAEIGTSVAGTPFNLRLASDDYTLPEHYARI